MPGACAALWKLDNYFTSASLIIENMRFGSEMMSEPNPAQLRAASVPISHFISPVVSST